MFQILAGDSRPAQPLDPDLTGLASDYDAAAKALAYNVSKAATSGGLTIQNSAGASVLLLGAGPSQGITAYGQVNGTSVSLSGGVTATDVTAIGAGGILDRQAATQDGIRLLGRAGGTTSLLATITPAALTASRTYNGPDLDGTLALTGASQAVSFAGVTCTTVTASGGITANGLTVSTNQATLGSGLKITGTPGAYTGSGPEIGFTGSRGLMTCYNRTGSAFLGFDFNALDLAFQVSGATRYAISSTGLHTFSGGPAPGTPGATDVLVGNGQGRFGSTTASTSPTTGALIVAGGVGVAGNITFDGSAGASLRMTNATTNGSVATTLGSVGPTGANAGNPLGWVRINVAGTDRYIPYW